MKEKYPALRMRNKDTDKWLVFFSAPATHINFWGGVPEKTEISNVENAGFQRGLNLTRVNKIKSFLAEQANIVQNPLLCAERESQYGKIQFVQEIDSDNDDVQLGYLEIDAVDIEECSLLELLKSMKEQLESRLEDLKKREVDNDLVEKIMKSESCLDDHGDETEEDADDSDQQISSEQINEDEQYFEDESFIVDFWDAVSARIVILEYMGAESVKRDSIAGFTKDAIAAFLKPVVIVDGQHRLEGALALARDHAAADASLKKIEDLIREGKSAKNAQYITETDLSRNLPVSLLMDTSPAEHVFQFVVVNQKATPITRPLLGTIVSTSLSDVELKGVTNRLLQAEIPIYESQAVSSLARDKDSPFCGFVDRGFGGRGNRGKQLHWSVLSGLVKIFRSLKGANLYHIKRRDNADMWKRQYLSYSDIVADYADHDFSTREEYWKDLNGPWRRCFIAFFKEVREYFGSDVAGAHNIWGNTDSNLFNKVSLHILLSDFFQYMCDTETGISSEDEIVEIFKKWTKGGAVSKDYFSRDWKCSNVKKDTTPTKKQWSNLWEDYRKDPKRLPNVNSYSKPY